MVMSFVLINVVRSYVEVKCLDAVCLNCHMTYSIVSYSLMGSVFIALTIFPFKNHRVVFFQLEGILPRVIPPIMAVTYLFQLLLASVF